MYFLDIEIVDENKIKMSNILKIKKIIWLYLQMMQNPFPSYL